MAQIRRKPRATPAREAELCERFAGAARDQGWDVFPEVAGWDLVLVWTKASIPGSQQTGDQLAIEAKMRSSADVLAQAHQRGRWQGPDFRAVLVPEASRDFHYLAGVLRFQTFTLRHCGPWRHKRERWDRDRLAIRVSNEIRWDRDRRLWLPPVPMSGSGGQPSPRRLTKWRVAALRLCLLLRARGWLTSEDFKREKIALATWRDRWLRADHGGARSGRLVRYVPIPGSDLPDVGYEAERDALAAA